MVTRQEGPAITLRPIGEDFFWPVTSRAPLMFRRGDNGRIVSVEMLVDGYFRAMELERVSEDTTR